MNFRLDGPEKLAWAKALEESKTDSQKALRALALRFIDADPLVRAAMLGSVPVDEEIAKLLVQRLVTKRGRRRG